ncbi:MAG: exodeoxyribonuclease V subunit alpha [Opitutales bacterium]|nr:exodeoxyribonuclease V subunit alpha [Opitutales bacterium]
MNELTSTLAPLSEHAADMLVRMAGGEAELLHKAVSLLLSVLEDGGVCISIAELGDADEVAARLSSLSVVGGAGDDKPLILDGGRLYLHRYHGYEVSLAQRLLQLASARSAFCNEGAGDALLSRSLAIVTGGPGTGKTTLAATLLEDMARASDGAPFSVALMAPTGKAAARLKESISRVSGKYPHVNITHGTVHRLLGPRAGSAYFKHDARRPLPYDVVVLDEASMMDLPLMAKLLDAIDASRSRIVILGDPGQLPSIHSGSALADIVEAARRAPEGAIARCHRLLSVNHRSGEEPELAELIDSVRLGDADRVMALLYNSDALELCRAPGPEQMPDYVEAELGDYIAALHGAGDADEALAIAASRRLVCMFRQGPCGSDAVNALSLALAKARGYYGRDGRFFHGMPIMVTRNAHRQNLFNGDSGIVLREGRGLCAYFQSPDGARAVSLQNLPPFEPAFALTVHKGQGSEYRDVGILLPAHDHPLLTRELFYTAVSRARRSIRVMGNEALIRMALARTVSRASGLAGRLAGP